MDRVEEGERGEERGRESLNGGDGDRDEDRHEECVFHVGTAYS